MKLTSYGAALEVTGSQHLIEANGKKILLDCGLFQGRRKDAFEKSRDFKYDPTAIDAMILSHAHIDHSGNIPHLVKEGFQGVIYCTKATKDLCDVMLMDSAHIQEADAEYFARKLRDTALQPIEPLYTQEDAEYALKFFKTIPLGKRFKLYDGIYLTFVEAGHVLGSAMVVLDIKDKEDGKEKRLIFTGDMGRCKMPIINDPYQIEEADYILTESTYGNRTHAPIEEGIPELARIINRTVRRGGKIIIPSFAFERTQELIYGIHLLIDRKEIPTNLPIFIDSPLATNITGIFQEHLELYDKEIRDYFNLDHNPFKPKQLKHVDSVEESKKLNYFIGPCIIISASGMCEAGRIRHHLKNNIEDPKNTIVVVGYMAQHTLGRKLVDGVPMVKIFDQMYKVNSEVVVVESFSAHADMNDLDEYISNIKGLKKVMLVHGEPDQSEPMAERLKTKLGVETEIMEPEKTVEL
ncbi:MBL fold metallo-hydrolase [Patescibacteria group bacterium]|nr:MBL fold metallo-hydrolase [Patescibacteria group bacterium]MBU1682386.1 MBL fold metallo-hydrolase [Patescibacteria group bacterium]MBU1935680.1 MBL fold metallo-hydrolase [Patescibacteria group bacterium]